MCLVDLYCRSHHAFEIFYHGNLVVICTLTKAFLSNNFLKNLISTKFIDLECRTKDAITAEKLTINCSFEVRPT